MIAVCSSPWPCSLLVGTAALTALFLVWAVDEEELQEESSDSIEI